MLLRKVLAKKSTPDKLLSVRQATSSYKTFCAGSQAQELYTLFFIAHWDARHEMFAGSNFRVFREFFIDSRKLNPVKTNSRQKNFRKN